MLKINIVCVGNLKDKFYIDGAGEYAKRLSRFCSLKTIELKEYTNLQSIEQIKKAEGEEILKTISGYVVLMDIKGTLRALRVLRVTKAVSCPDGQLA